MVDRATATPDKPHVGERADSVLAVLLAGTFIAALDVAIVNVAAPEIQLDLGVSDAA